VYNMLKDGRLSARKIGKEWRFTKDEVYEVMMGKSKRTIQN
jgi:excisionase family DNA binding protein